MQKAHLPTKPGFSIVEAMLSTGLFVMIVSALVGSYLYGQEATQLAGNRARAVFLAEEGIEAVRNIRDANFNNLVDGTYGLTISGNQWVLSGASDTTQQFTRNIVVSSIDAKRKSVTANVSWQQNAQRTGLTTIATELTNWVAVGIGNWALAVQESTVNLTGSSNAVKVATEGNYAYIVRASGPADFVILDISNPAVPTVASTMTLPGNLNDIALSGGNAYIASSDNSQELQVVDVSTPTSPVVIGSYNDAGSEDAIAIYLDNAKVYMGFNGGNDFAIVNVSTPSSPALLGVINISPVEDIIVLGNFAYLATADNVRELDVMDISNPAAPFRVGSLNLAGNDDGLSITGYGTNIYLGKTANILYWIDVTNTASPTVVTSDVVGSSVNDLALGGGNTLLFTGNGSTTSELRIYDLSVPSILSNVNLSAALNGVAYNTTLDRLIGVSSSNTAEVFIIKPQ